MRASLAVYGIQDINNSGYPELVHDHSICLMRDGVVQKFTALERITRKKLDNTMHKNIYFLLKDEDLITNEECEYDIIFVDNEIGRAFISDDGKIRFEAPMNDNLKTDLELGYCRWFGKITPSYVLNHELAHIYSCVLFFGIFKENSLLIHFDGGASKSNFSAWTWKNETLKNVEYGYDMKYLSTLYNANALNFFILNVSRPHHNSLPGKYMGYSAYGNYDSEIEQWLIENNFFTDIWEQKSVFFHAAAKRFNFGEKHFNAHDKFLQDIAATVQVFFTKELKKKLISLQQQTNTDYLYYSGGSALNIVSNTEIVNSKIFKDVYIPPCTSDTGLALGAATFLEIKKGNIIDKHSPFLNNWNLEISEQPEESDYKELILKTVSLLLEKKIIAICNDYGEIGPRALGNRSIIALANDKNLSHKISITCKQREWYRPVAPIILEKNVKLFTGLNQINHLSKYMLLEFNILEKYHKELRGVVHVNGTARIQTIFERDDNKFIYDILTLLDAQHNIRAIINTSFNSRDEAIVNNLHDARLSATKMKIDTLIYNYKFVELN